MQHNPTSWSRLGIATARFCISAWIGAAILFVVVGVREVTTTEFTSEVKDRLVTLRFPAYYIAGATLIGLTFMATTIALAQHTTRGLTVALMMLMFAAGLMAADYVWIYSPLAAMVTPPGQPRTMAFTTLHHWSMRINTVHLAACLIAAMALMITEPKSSPRDASPLPA